MIVCKNARDYITYYQSFGASRSYIPKKEVQLIQRLTRKRVLMHQLQCYQRQRKILEDFISGYSDTANLIMSPIKSIINVEDKILNSTNNSNQVDDQSLIDNQIQHTIIFHSENPKHMENLTVPTPRGHMVRSKSEAIIATALYYHNVEYYYEKRLVLGEVEMYPDFTMCMQKEKVIYWEHFGMMDNPIYAKNVYRKLELYSSNGIFPGINLIVTFESSENPIDPRMLESILDYYCAENVSA